MNLNHFKPDKSHLTLRDIQTQIVDASLLFGVLAGVIGIALDIQTAKEVGWQPSIFLIMGIVMVITLISFFRNKIPYHFKTGFLITAVYIIAISELIALGLVGSSSIWFVLTVLLTMVFHNMRIGIIVYSIVVVTIATITMLMRMEILALNIDYNVLVTSESAWLSRLLIIIFVSAMLVTSFGRIISVLQDQLKRLQQTASELETRTQALTQEIEKREQTEQALADAIVQLKGLDQLKDKFIDSVSHELRTPISNIQLYHQLLALKPEKATQYLQTLDTETQRLSHIVEQMIHASGDTYDMALTTMVEIDVLDITKQLFDSYQEKLAENNITLSFPQNPQTFTTLAASEHMEHLLINVVDNAVKYTPEHGTIRISCEQIKKGDKDCIRLIIANTSEPLLDGERTIIFERFYRGETSLSMGIPGAGLGLSITKQLIEKYSGAIRISYLEDEKMISFTLEFVAVRPFKEILADEIETVSSSA